MRRLGLLFLVLIWPCAALAQADDDRGYLQGLLEDALSGAGREVRIVGFEGALSSSARLSEMTIADANGIWLTLRNAQLDWRRSALLRGRIEVDQLTADELIIARLPSTEPDPDTPGGLDLPPPEATAFSLPELPVSVEIGTLSIGRVELAEAVLGIAAQISLDGSARLIDGAGAVDLDVRRLDGPVGALEIAGTYGNATEQLALSLVLTEEADGLLVNLVDLPDRPSVDLRIQGDGPISDFAARIGLKTAGVDRLSGDVTLTSDSDDAGVITQTFGADLNGDIRPLLRPQYHAFLGDDLALELRGQRSDQGGLDLDRLVIASSALNLDGQLSLDRDGWPRQLDLSGSITAPDGETALLPIPGPETRLARALFSLGYDAARGDGWQLALSADDLTRVGIELGAVRVTGAGQILTGEGRRIGQVDGLIGFSASGLDLGSTDLTQAVGTSLRGGFGFLLQEDQPFRLSDIAVTGDDYDLTGAAQIAVPDGRESPVITTDVDLNAADLARFAPLAGQPLSGAVEVSLTGDVTPLDGAFDLEIAGRSEDLQIGLAQVDPLIAGAGTLDAAVLRDETGTRLDRFTLTTAQASLAGQASLSSQASAGQITARIRDAGVIHPDMAGPVTLNADFDQTGPRWDADVKASGPGGLRLTAALRTPQGAERSGVQAQVAAEDLAPFGWLVGRDLTGGVAFDLDAAVDLTQVAGEVTLSGAARNVTLGLAELDRLLVGTAQIDLKGRRDAAGTIVLDQLALSAPRLSADASGSVAPDRTRLRANIDLPNLGLLVPELPGPLGIEALVSSTGGDWDVTGALFGPGGMRADVQGSVAPDASRTDLRATGVAPLALANRQLAPNIASGQLRFDLGLRGAPALGSLSGRVQPEGARLTLPQQSLAFETIDAAVQLGGGTANVTATLAPTNGGTIRVTGPVGLQPPFNGDLTVVLSALGISQAGLVETQADGQINLRGALGGGAQIGGTINLGEVVVQLASTAGADSAAVPGLIHLNEPAAVRQTRSRAGLIQTTSGRSGAGRPYGLDLLINAPARIFIRGRGLDAEMGGALRLGGTTSAVAPSGRFDLLRGRLSILGQRIDLTEGFVQPQGDLDAYMQVVAEASADDIDVRFVIEGQLSAPTFSMTSSPELPQDEILARFLFGRDLSEISALQALQIAGSIAQLSGRSTGGLGQIGAGLGLDDLDVTTGEDGGTNVSAGKYLSDNVYSDVTRTSDGETEINLNLSLSPSVTVRGTARTDSSTGIGIFLERDY